MRIGKGVVNFKHQAPKSKEASMTNIQAPAKYRPEFSTTDPAGAGRMNADRPWIRGCIEGLEDFRPLRYYSDVSTIAEIEAAIAQLPPRDLWKLKEDLDRRCAHEWDAQMEEDARAGGPLDRIAQKALKECEAGSCRPLE